MTSQLQACLHHLLRHLPGTPLVQVQETNKHPATFRVGLKIDHTPAQTIEDLVRDGPAVREAVEHQWPTDMTVRRPLKSIHIDEDGYVVCEFIFYNVRLP